MGDNLAQCTALRTWRESLVNGESTPVTEQDAPNTLNLMLRTEYLCGEDALLKRTTHVLAAYRQGSSAAGAGSGGSPVLRHELSTLQQQSLLDQERRRLQQALQAQTSRQQDQTGQQLQQLELELIRNQRP